MTPLAVVGLLVALVAVATALGLVLRATTGRARARTGSDVVDLAELAPGETPGGVATLLQFSTEFCAPCVATARQLDRLAGTIEGVRHVEVDVTTRPDIASRFSILQSPTTLVLDGSGAVRARIGGAPRLPELWARLDALAASPSTTAGATA